MPEGLSVEVGYSNSRNAYARFLLRDLTALVNIPTSRVDLVARTTENHATTWLADNWGAFQDALR